MIDVAGIACEYPIAVIGNEYNGCIDRVICPCLANEHSRFATQGFIHSTNIDRVQQACELRLAACRISPHLTDHDSISAQGHVASLCDAKAGHHRSVVAVHCHECASVENEGAQADSPV